MMRGVNFFLRESPGFVNVFLLQRFFEPEQSKGLSEVVQDRAGLRKRQEMQNLRGNMLVAIGPWTRRGGAVSTGPMRVAIGLWTRCDCKGSSDLGQLGL